MNKNLPPFQFLGKCIGTLLFVCIGFSLNAQLIINEFSAANWNGFNSAVGNNEDWVELHNMGSSSMDISGYYLSDRLTNPTKWEIPSGTSISAGGYLLIWCTDEDAMIGGELHAGFKISQTKGNESVVLADPSGTILDLHEIDIPCQTNHSYARDANGEWGISLNPTPNSANGQVMALYELTPEMSPGPGFYSGSVTVSVTAPNPNATIYYTTDGSRPSDNDQMVNGPIMINETTVLRAVAYSDDANVPPSYFETNTYFIDDFHSVLVVSISGGDEIDNLLAGAWNARPQGYLEIFAADGAFIDEAMGEYNKHGNDSWAYDQRGIDWITRDQMGYEDETEGKLFGLKDRVDFQRLIFKAAANDNYPFENGGAHVRDAYVHTLSQLADMAMDERTSEFCVLYINGEYWGVYDMREKVDDNDYTKYYYNQGRQYIDMIKTWGQTWEEYGSWDDWYDLRAFIENNDMTDPANYSYVEERFEVISLIDYVLLHAHIVSKDWLNWNTAWWRGRNPDGGAQKWKYLLWDEDATFGHYINYTQVPDVSAYADPCNVELIGDNVDFEGHIGIFEKLYENENFKSLYVNRYADLNNSFFTCDYMIGLLDSMIAVIEPEMPRQTQRWGGSIGGWEANVQELKDFILIRCTGDLINDAIVDCYDVTGPFDVEVNIEPANSPNGVKVNTFVPSAFPYTGEYFGGVTLTMTAAPVGNWTFDHWEVMNHDFGPNEYADAITMAIDSGDVITAYFMPGVPCESVNGLIVDPGLFSAQVQWIGPSNNISFEVRYRKVGTNDWTVISTADLNYAMSNLEECADYEVQVRTICDATLSSYQTLIFTTDCLSNTSELEGSNINNLNIYPNPFQDRLFVDFDLANTENVTIEVHTLHGQRVIQQPKGNLASGNHLIEIPLGQELSQGMYLLRVVTDNGSVVKRIMKNN